LFEVRLELTKRTIFTRMTGVFTEPEMRAWGVQYREATKRFRGLKHMVIADMRGLKTLQPMLAAMMGAEIAYARQNGVVLCAHVSDETVQRLQARRIVRMNSSADDITVDVTSVDEARAVVDEARPRIGEKTSLMSIRAPV
jgi:hypothetical protein